MKLAHTASNFSAILVTALVVIVRTSAFGIRAPRTITTQPWDTTATTPNPRPNHKLPYTTLRMESSSLDEDEEEVEPGTMRVAEIKSELNLRAVDHSDCFDKESLVQRLREARVTGKADPSIIDRFNTQRLEDTFQEKTLDLTDEVIDETRAADGSLPGGISPDMLKELMGNPELMALLQNPKMQDAMKLMMTGGQDSLEQMMKEDEEVYEVVTKLNNIMNKAV